MKIVACPSCNQIVRISDDTQFCPQCGQYMKKPPPPQNKHLGLLYGSIVVIAGIAVTILMIVLNKHESAPSTYQAPAKPSIYSLFSVKINKFSVGEYNTYEIIGEVKNISSRPFRFVHVKIMFYDSKGNIVGEDTTYACSNDYIMPGQTKSFKSLGENQSDYKRARAEVTDYLEVE